MTKLVDAPLTTDFTACQALSAYGTHIAGSLAPKGISDRITISDSVARLYLNISDPETNAGLRSEVIVGTFPTGTGEYWTKMDFKYDWDYVGGVVIGSWYATPDVGDGLKYVPIGIRIRNSSLVIQVPQSLPAETMLNKVIATVPIQKNQWHTLCIHANLQTDSTGFREFFLDGIPIVREFNIPTTYTDVVGPYFKVGPYDGYDELGFTELVLYLRNVSMWSGNDGYKTVMGNVPSSYKHLLEK